MASRKRSQEKAHKNQGLNFDSGGITKKQRRREREKELRRSEAFSSIFFSFLAGTSSLFSFSPTAERAQFVTSSSYAAQESGSKCNEEKVGKERLRQLIEFRRDLGWILTSKVPWVFLCLRPIMLVSYGLPQRFSGGSNTIAQSLCGPTIESDFLCRRLRKSLAGK